MNTPHNDMRFDRLVDGELTPSEYQTLLQQLDQTPEGWRQLALAFLEAQAWERDFGALRATCDAGRNASAATPAASTSTGSGPTRWTRHLTQAASLLVTIALGVAIDRLWIQATVAVPAIVRTSPRSEPLTIPTFMPSDGRSSGAAAGGGLDPQQPLGNLHFVMERNGERTSPLAVPFYRADEQKLRQLPHATVLTPQFVKSLEQRGHTVRRQQELLSIDLENGQQAIVPVERVDIVPLARPPY